MLAIFKEVYFRKKVPVILWAYEDLIELTPSQLRRG